jgi:hypothetical protein
MIMSAGEVEDDDALTPTELAMLKVALKYKKSDDDANPDIGPGYSDVSLLRSLVKEIERHAGKQLRIPDNQWNEILSVIQ